MKNFIFAVFCSIFNFTEGQITTKTQIDTEIKKAKELSTLDPHKSIILSEKIYNLSKNNNYKKGMLESGNILMAKYFDDGNFKKVVELSKGTENLAIEMEDYQILSNTYRLRASSYTELGFNDESLKQFKKALDITNKIKSKNFRCYQESLIYIGLANYSAHVNMPIDSVVYYQKKCLETITKLDESKDFINIKYYTLALTYINLGMTSNALHAPKDAELFFSKALNIYKNKKYKLNQNLLVTIFNEFSWLYHDQKKYEKAKYYAQRAEKLEKQNKNPYMRRDIYEVYFKSCVELGEKETSKKYMNLYTVLNDSLVNAEKRTINTPVKHLIDDQKEIHSNNIQNIIMTLSIIMVLLTIFIWFLWKRNQTTLHKRYKMTIEKLKKADETLVVTKQVNCVTEKNINITDETINLILVKLDKFEKSQKFIKKDLSLTSLANDLNTNTRYLSEIIKEYKKKNYNNYINDLRIKYIVKLLYEVQIYREYKISYLAETCGFSSREVFAVIFKKETGVTPSYFITNLKKDINVDLDNKNLSSITNL